MVAKIFANLGEGNGLISFSLQFNSNLKPSSDFMIWDHISYVIVHKL